MVEHAASRPNTRDYPPILRHGIPLLDVRAPVEFSQGAFPSAVNLPLMQDSERAVVGACYKQAGQQAAIELGHQLVNNDVRRARIDEWKAWFYAHPDGYLCCARGGLRSHIVQQWLREEGITAPLVEGGYHQLRRFALRSIDELSELPMVIVGGNTGCGKTDLIATLPNGIDLEGLACHRGSSFGRRLVPQPTQATFEHHLAITLLQRVQPEPHFHWVLEDEGPMIGSRHLPDSLRAQMVSAPVVVIDDPFAFRLERLQREYFAGMLASFFAHTPDEDAAWLAFSDYLHHALYAIRRRLGDQRFQSLSKTLDRSLKAHRQLDAPDAHLAWLVPLLTEYYDPMYRYQLEKKSARIIFQGNSTAVAEWLAYHRQRGLPQK